MKRAKSMQNMEVSQSSLLGVRTRARAKQTSESMQKLSFSCSPSNSKPHKSSQSTLIPSTSEPQYLQLRSRRLEKFPRLTGEGKKSAEERHSGSKLESAGDRRVDQDPEIVLPSVIRPSDVELLFVDGRLLDMPARNSCSSRPALVSVGFPSATSLGIEDVSHSRMSSPAQSSFPACSQQAVVPPTSTHMGAFLRSGPPRMVTRHLKHDVDSKLCAIDANMMEMDTRTRLTEASSPSGNIQRESEVGPCFGESPTIAGPSVRERQQGPSTRSQKRECPRGDLTHSKDAPELLCRTGESSQVRLSSAVPFRRPNEALFSTEIEAFFANAEQMERRRFIERYNFDPLTERPLKGRYLWLKE